MKEMTAQSFEALLKARLGDIAPAVASQLHSQYQKKGETVQQAVLSWLETGNECDLQAAGYTVRQLKSQFGMNYVAAAFTIDWLMRDPERATTAIRAGIK